MFAATANIGINLNSDVRNQGGVDGRQRGRGGRRNTDGRARGFPEKGIEKFPLCVCVECRRQVPRKKERNLFAIGLSRSLYYLARLTTRSSLRNVRLTRHERALSIIRLQIV